MADHDRVLKLPEPLWSNKALDNEHLLLIDGIRSLQTARCKAEGPKLQQRERTTCLWAPLTSPKGD